MIFGKYGEMILANMEKNYPYRKQELELTGELDIKIFERERYILDERFIIGKSQMEIAEELDISQAQVSRLEKKAINQLKKVLK